MVRRLTGNSYIEDLTTEETAAYLGLKPETVKTRLHRARRLLRAAPRHRDRQHAPRCRDRVILS